MKKDNTYHVLRITEGEGISAAVEKIKARSEQS